MIDDLINIIIDLICKNDYARYPWYSENMTYDELRKNPIKHIGNTRHMFFVDFITKYGCSKYKVYRNRIKIYHETHYINFKEFMKLNNISEEDLTKLIIENL